MPLARKRKKIDSRNETEEGIAQAADNGLDSEQQTAFIPAGPGNPKTLTGSHYGDIFQNYIFPLSSESWYYYCAAQTRSNWRTVEEGKEEIKKFFGTKKSERVEQILS